MGSYARFEHYLTTLEVETCPKFWPPSPVSGPLCTVGQQSAGRAAGRLARFVTALAHRQTPGHLGGDGTHDATTMKTKTEAALSRISATKRI